MAGAAWFQPTAIGLNITRKTKPPFEQWETEILGAELRRKAEPWLRGDLYLQGEEWYGEDQATSIFDNLTMDIKTWQNNASVCSRIEISRRREDLTFSHHSEVAYLEPEQFPEDSAMRKMNDPKRMQDFYLQQAVDNGLSVRALRDLINDAKGKKKVEFEVGEFDERADKLAKKVGKLIEAIEFAWPTMGKDAVEYLFTAHDSLDAAADELVKVQKKAGKKAA